MAQAFFVVPHGQAGKQDITIRYIDDSGLSFYLQIEILIQISDTFCISLGIVAISPLKPDKEN